MKLQAAILLILIGTLSPLGADPAGAMKVDLETVLRLALADNRQIAAAREAVEEANAQLKQSRYLWIPDLSVGVSFEHHDGPLQESSGRIRHVSRSSVGAGAGVNAVAAGTPGTPGLALHTSIADAYYEPLAARQNQQAMEATNQLVRETILLDVVEAYFELVRNSASRAILQQSVKNAAELAKLTSDYASSGEGLESDAERAKVAQLIQQGRLEVASGDVVIASTRLAALLHLPSDVQLVPAETTPAPIRFPAEAQPLDQLVAGALGSRPEVTRGDALSKMAQTRVNQATKGLLFPHLTLGASAGGFGGGVGGGVGNLNGRTDLTASVFWRVEGLGLGRKEMIRERRSQLRQTELQQEALLDAIVAEVKQEHAIVQSRKRQLEITSQAVESARKSFELNRSRIFERQGLPIEVLQAIQSLSDAHLQYVESVAAHNQAQYRLARAAGVWSRGKALDE